MGADKGILIKGEKTDSFVVAIFSSNAENPWRRFNLIRQHRSISMDEIAPMLAELPDLPAATVIVRLD